MLYAIVAVLILILDQGMKYWTTLKIELGTGQIPLIDGVIHLTNIRNSGIAFGLFSDGQFRWVLVVLAVVVSIFIAFLIATRRIRGGFGRWTAVMIIAGALGNAIDRAVHGWVVDMFELEFLKFYIFNVADVFLVLGGILFCIAIIVYKEPEEQPSAGSREAIRAAKMKAEKLPKASPFDSREAVEPRTKASSFIDWTEPLPKLDGKGGVVPAEAPEFGGIAEIVPTWSPPSAPKKKSPAPESPASPAKSGDSDFSLEDILREFGSGD